MIRKMTGFALIVFGDLALIVALAADDMGLGAPGSTTGYKQIALAMVAIAIQLVGIVLTQVESKGKGFAS